MAALAEKTDYFAEPIEWMETGDAEYPYQAVFNGEKLTLRLNDFPAESLYTLMIDGEEIADYEDLSPNWTEVEPELIPKVHYHIAD